MSYFRSPCGAVPGMQIPYAQYGAVPQNQPQPMMPGTMQLPALPTGVPTGPSFAGPPITDVVPTTPSLPQVPQTVESPFYTAGYLRNLIGKTMRVEFLIGTSGPLVDRTGTLVEVGASYIVLKLIESDDTVMCDLYSIKFVTVFY